MAKIQGSITFLSSSCFKKWRIVSFFYDGLTPKTKKLVETTCNGQFMDKNEDEADEHFDWLAEHASEWEP